MTQINISYVYQGGRGHMTMCLDNHFPAAQNKLKKLIKVIEMDWEHRDDLLNTLLVFCKGSKKVIEERMPRIRRDYADAYQGLCDTQRLADTHKFPNGVYLSDVELIQTEKLLKEFKETFRRLGRILKHNEKQHTMLERNISVIQEAIQKWKR